MQLSEIGYTGKKAEKLIKKGIYTGDALLYTMPRKFLYFNKTYPLEYKGETYNRIQDKEAIAIKGTVVKVVEEYKSNLNRSLIKIRVQDEASDKLLFINFLGFHHMKAFFENCLEKKVIVGGKLEYNEQFGSFSMMNPTVFSPEINKYQRILPIYSKYKGISEEYYTNSIDQGIKLLDNDYLPERIIRRYGLLSRGEAIRAIHHPLTSDAIKRAKQRIIFDSLLYFALSLENKNDAVKGESKYRITKTDITNKFISELPYTLTEGQDISIKDMINTSHRGSKISALVQGDVGSGKTIVAMSMMFAMAENGYQSVLMAPTTVLARQHYEDFKEKGDKYGFTVCLLSNELSKKEKDTLIERISLGEIQMVIGTHSCISEGVKYHNLALVVTDEEHKFGTAQREELIKKASEGTHVITMSGTPIPRTLANTLYGNDTKVYSLKLPAERKPIQTAICSSDKPVFDWMEKEMKEGHQCYVVCPLIEEGEEDSTMAGISSIEVTSKKYMDYFNPKGYKCGVITGKTSKEEQTAIMQSFIEGKTHILIATTVIEVGVNNPNATVMVITGAERFGLSTLHQLRGRVGRGKIKSYCILQKTPGFEGGSNLEILCKETDGLAIAKEDLKNRGPGNIIGMEQSGKNNYIDLMLQYPNMYERIKTIAKDMHNSSISKEFMDKYEEKYLEID